MNIKSKKMQKLRSTLIALVTLALVASCAKEVSNVTGWEYNNPKNGGFQKVPFIAQATGPGLVFIEGGTFTMGRVIDDVMSDWNNRPRRVTVSSFYIDQTEVTNFNWCEYLYWLKRSYADFPGIVRNALPDTLVWRSPLGFNEKYVKYYLRHPAYRDYPVVGVNWLQASDFCKWRTDRVNEHILIHEGILNFNPKQSDEATFNTEAYLNGQYEAGTRQKLTDLDPANATMKNDKIKELGKRNVRLSDGILLPRYRLPTEAEWEFAYYGLIGNTSKEDAELITNRRVYAWNGHYVRQDDEQYRGQIRANFVRGHGDYMGIAGALNDGYDATAPVDAYWPNDYGLYNMAGNVAEWVMDVYRPLTSEDENEFRPFRGNVFQTKLLNDDGSVAYKNFQVTYDVYAMKEYLNEFERVRYQRISAQKYNPEDSVIPIGIAKANEAANPVRKGYAPTRTYVYKNYVKDSMEMDIFKQINKVLDQAIKFENNKFPTEASTYIQENLFDGIFADQVRIGPQGEEYSFEIIPMLRSKFADFIVNTPGKLKYRNVTAEENIDRRNYRKADYIDYEDGDIESSIYYNNTKRLDDINNDVRDPDLVMYQSKYEQYDLKGKQIKPGGDQRTSWPTTLISDKSRVYKGGSWRDRAYWIVGGNRRFLDENQSTDYIGFRCAMDKLGSPRGVNSKVPKNRNYNDYNR